ncbi:hypothetical protein RFI_27330 [Reticulomyxa filosa]|uniref:Uncharacterized protein n=1 Tax=Reticulomyxa filosa TaxID=46433 RepID=X6M7U0_RETFI|nr:hypothetical protein RFI_27330 [Reticulomyxa filosa]|eukprot:ETO10048.1 hypothetical protein RFI_27330 [Reticulomyxa filosa]
MWNRQQSNGDNWYFITTVATFKDMINKTNDISKVNIFFQSMIRVICYDVTVLESVKDAIVPFDTDTLNIVAFQSVVDPMFLFRFKKTKKKRKEK